jgi:hypothetical protein
VLIAHQTTRVLGGHGQVEANGAKRANPTLLLAQPVGLSGDPTDQTQAKLRRSAGLAVSCALRASSIPSVAV